MSFMDFRQSDFASFADERGRRGVKSLLVTGAQLDEAFLYFGRGGVPV